MSLGKEGGQQPLSREKIQVGPQQGPHEPVGRPGVHEAGNGLLNDRRAPSAFQPENRLGAGLPDFRRGGAPDFRREGLPTRFSPVVDRGFGGAVIIDRGTPAQPAPEGRKSPIIVVPAGEVSKLAGDGQGGYNPGERPIEAKGGGRGKRDGGQSGEQGQGSENTRQQPRQPRQPSRVGRAELWVRGAVREGREGLKDRADRRLLRQNGREVPDDPYRAKTRVAAIGRMKADLTFPQGMKPGTWINMGVATTFSGAVNVLTGNPFLDLAAGAGALYLGREVGKGVRNREREFHPLIKPLVELKIAAGIEGGGAETTVSHFLPEHRLAAAAEFYGGVMMIGKGAMKAWDYRQEAKSMGKAIIEASTDVERAAMYDLMVGDPDNGRPGQLMEKRTAAENTAARIQYQQLSLAARLGRDLTVDEHGQVVPDPAKQPQTTGGEGGTRPEPGQGGTEPQPQASRTQAQGPDVGKLKAALIRRRIRKLGDDMQGANREAAYYGRLRELLIQNRGSGEGYAEQAADLYRTFDMH